jgi:hypothetical protein
LTGFSIQRGAPETNGVDDQKQSEKQNTYKKDLQGNTIYFSINIHFAVLLSFTLLKQTSEMALVEYFNGCC